MGGGTSDGRNQANQLINIVYPINKILSIPSGAGFLPSTVWIPYILLFLWITERLKEGPPTWSPFPLPSTMVFFFFVFVRAQALLRRKWKVQVSEAKGGKSTFGDKVNLRLRSIFGEPHRWIRDPTFGIIPPTWRNWGTFPWVFVQQIFNLFFGVI